MKVSPALVLIDLFIYNDVWHLRQIKRKNKQKHTSIFLKNIKYILFNSNSAYVLLHFFIIIFTSSVCFLDVDSASALSDISAIRLFCFGFEAIVMFS